MRVGRNHTQSIHAAYFNTFSQVHIGSQPNEEGERDGVITPLEFFTCVNNLCSKSGKMELTLEDIEAMFREVDEDGDGDLDIEEFEGMLKKYMFED